MIFIQYYILLVHRQLNSNHKQV